jgi:hypothetical protein
MARIKDYRQHSLRFTRKRHEQRTQAFLSGRELQREFQQRRSGRLVQPFKIEEVAEIEFEIPMDLWPNEWWWLPDGRPRFGEEAVNDF